MPYHDSDTPARTVSGTDGYVADMVVVQHTPHGVLVTRADIRTGSTSQPPPRR